MNEELKPCPFCGNDDKNFFDLSKTPALYSHVYCLKCMAKGPVHMSREKATEAWNARKTPFDLKIAMHNEDSTEREIKEYLSNPDTRVWINHNNEAGEWLYSVQVYGTGFWMDSFKTEKQALKYIKKHNLITV